MDKKNIRSNTNIPSPGHLRRIRSFAVRLVLLIFSSTSRFFFLFSFYFHVKIFLILCFSLQVRRTKRNATSSTSDSMCDGPHTQPAMTNVWLCNEPVWARPRMPSIASIRELGRMEETTRANGGKVKCKLLFDLQILSLTGKVIRRHVISPVAVLRWTKASESQCEFPFSFCDRRLKKLQSRGENNFPSALLCLMTRNYLSREDELL